MDKNACLLGRAPSGGRSGLAPTDAPLWGGATRPVYPPSQGAMSFCFHLPLRGSSLPSPSKGVRDGGWPTRSSGPVTEYVRRNHLTYSSVARTTSPCSVAVTVYVSRGGDSDPSGRPPNASRSSRSLRSSRPLVVEGLPFGGRAGPSNRCVLLGL